MDCRPLNLSSILGNTSLDCQKIGSANKDSNPGLLGEKRERHLCAMPPPSQQHGGKFKDLSLNLVQITQQVSEIQI